MQTRSQTYFKIKFLKYSKRRGMKMSLLKRRDRINLYMTQKSDAFSRGLFAILKAILHITKFVFGPVKQYCFEALRQQLSHEPSNQISLCCTSNELEDSPETKKYRDNVFSFPVYTVEHLLKKMFLAEIV